MKLEQSAPISSEMSEKQPPQAYSLSNELPRQGVAQELFSVATYEGSIPSSSVSANPAGKENMLVALHRDSKAPNQSSKTPKPAPRSIAVAEETPKSAFLDRSFGAMNVTSEVIGLYGSRLENMIGGSGAFFYLPFKTIGFVPGFFVGLLNGIFEFWSPTELEALWVNLPSQRA